jgi:SAM-dependent methyltransferase
MTTAAAIPTGNTYDKYATKNPVERRLMAGFFGCLDDVLPGHPPASVLEVGVGEGEVSGRVRDRYPGARFVGVDLPDDDLATHWRRRGLHGAFADIAHLPFGDDAFDLVLAIEVLEHVPDPVAALTELGRVARSYLVLSVPREPIWRIANMARGKYLRHLGNTPGHIQHWSRRGFVRLVNRHLEPVAVRTPFPWTMVAARSLARGSAPETAAVAVPDDIDEVSDVGDADATVDSATPEPAADPRRSAVTSTEKAAAARPGGAR